MKKLALLFVMASPFIFGGCGVIIKKHPDPDPIQQQEKGEEEKGESRTEVSFVIPGPPVRHPYYPYDINGFPNGEMRNVQPGNCFMTVCY